MIAEKVFVCTFLAVIVCAATTDVKQCKGGNEIPEVQITPSSTKSPYRLKHGTTTHITMKITPGKDYKDVRNHVTANLGFGDLPFIGVDGNSVCEKLTTADGAAASCPVKAGETYIYKDSFPVLAFYPKVSLTVHWALKGKNGGNIDSNDIACFELPARISD